MDALNSDCKRMKLMLEGTSIHLLPQRAVWLPQMNAVCIADTHFGKAATFRLAGLAVPEGTTTAMLKRIDQLVAETGAETLIVLGDFTHSGKVAARDYVDELVAWRDSNVGLNIVLVLGNHDRHSRGLIERLAFHIVQEGERFGQVELRHFPNSTTADSLNPQGNKPLVLSGHLHPGCSIAIAPKVWKKFPCFVIGQTQIILPAFGEFTGLAQVDRTPFQRIIACVEDELIEIDPV